MTKKHFKLFAEAISKIEADAERMSTAELIGRVCAQINPRFDWVVWYDACNVKGRLQPRRLGV